MTKASPLVLLFVFFVGCKGSAEPASTTTAPDTPEAQPGPSAEPEGEAEVEAEAEAGWQRGTITIGPDGGHGIHADDDSVTVCAPDLPAELQSKDLAVRFRGEFIPPAPNERRWCTLAKDLKVERAE